MRSCTPTSSAASGTGRQAMQGEDRLLDHLLETGDKEREAAAKKQTAELTAEILNTLIEKSLIHEATEGEFGGRDQEIEIISRFVGKIE